MNSSPLLRTSLIISGSGENDATKIVLESVALQTQLPCDVVIIDPRPEKDADLGLLRSVDGKSFQHGRIAGPQKNETRSGALNEAVRVATGNYLIFIDGECVPHRRFIADHARLAQLGSFVRGRRARIRSRYIHRISPGSFHPLAWFLRRRLTGFQQGLRRPWPAVHVNDPRPISGSNFAVWREDLLRVNGFNEAFDERGFEIIELAERLRNAGIDSRTITGQAIVYHLGHRHDRRYGSNVSIRILDRARREKLIVCEQGFQLATPTHQTRLVPLADDRPHSQPTPVRSTATAA